MVRLRISLVIFLTGCIPVIEIPIEFQIESGISDEGVNNILNMVDEVNSSLGYYYGGDILVPDEERYTDPDGLDLYDLTDGRRVIYEISVDSDIYRDMKAYLSYNKGPNGEGLLDDMILVSAEFVEFHWSKYTILHEFGHWFQLLHRDDPESVMNPVTTNLIKFSPEDIQAFCLAQTCEISPF